MLWWVVASTSVVLIAAGLWLILRDVNFAAVGSVARRSLVRPVYYISQGRGLMAEATSRFRWPKRQEPVEPMAATAGAPISVETLAARLAHVAPEAAQPIVASPAVSTMAVAPPPAARPAPLQPMRSAAVPSREEEQTVPLLLPPVRDAIYAGRARTDQGVAPAMAASAPTPASVPPGPAVPPPLPVRSALDELSELMGDVPSDTTSDIPMHARDAALEARWRQIAPLVQVAALGVNQRTFAARFELAPEGDAGWSAGNAGYGHFRRVMVSGGSVAWLRTELRHGNRLSYSLRAHAREHAMLNSNVELGAWPLTEDQIARGLVDVVRGAVLFATARSETAQATATPVVPVAAPPPPPQRTAETSLVPRRSTQLQPEQRIVDEAISLVNGAFSDVKARLVALPPPSGAADRHERAFQIQYQARPAGLLIVDDAPDHIGLSVGVSDPSRLAAAQRSALKRDGTGPYELAEAIATCIWPTLALEGADAVLH